MTTVVTRDTSGPSAPSIETAVNYDGLGRKSSTSIANAAYDDSGNLVKRVDALARTTCMGLWNRSLATCDYTGINGWRFSRNRSLILP